jgi:L-amino acid N-acyltransferase YncA
LKRRILKEFVAKNGKPVILRKPRWDDLDDLLDFINSLIEEGADIMLETPVTREEETDWLGKRLASIEKGEVIGIVAEVDGKAVANSEVGRRSGSMSHVGDLGIAVRKDYRRIGIGKKLMKTLIEESKKVGIKVLVLEVFGSNSAAKTLYTKMGFKDAGRLPKGVFRKGKYIDLLRMTLEL